MSVSLIYVPSREIVRYVSEHPIDWLDEQRHLANRPGCLADQAGMTPVPAVQMFLECYHKKQNLFSQKEYQSFCFSSKVWAAWLVAKPPQQVEAVGVKLRRNFYPAMVDALHVWALLVETGAFDYCALDSAKDAISKTDLTVSSGGQIMRIALSAESSASTYANGYKQSYRGGPPAQSHVIRLSMAYPKSPGNKRWYRREDFGEVIATARGSRSLSVGNATLAPPTR